SRRGGFEFFFRLLLGSRHHSSRLQVPPLNLPLSYPGRRFQELVGRILARPSFVRIELSCRGTLAPRSLALACQHALHNSFDRAPLSGNNSPVSSSLHPDTFHSSS